MIILGTCVGAGMLSLPVVASEYNILTAFGLLLTAWLLMTVGALALLEVNLWLPPATHMITMARKTLGFWGELFTWLSYLFVLYALLCAYIAAVSGVVNGIAGFLNVSLSQFSAVLIGLLPLVIVVTAGLSTIDWVNRGLLVAKLLAFIVAMLLVGRHVNPVWLSQGHWKPELSPILVMVTSFGYAVVLPSLRLYFPENGQKLIRLVYVGSIVPLVIYILWMICILGVLPRQGEYSLAMINQHPHTTSALMGSLYQTLKTGWVNTLIQFFIAISALTSFLGVALSLTDFLCDGLRWRKQGWQAVAVYVLTFLPPFMVVLWVPGLFIKALSYAGILTLLLLVLLPVGMLYSGRYRTGLGDNQLMIVPGGKPFLIAVMSISALIIVSGFVLKSGLL